MDSIRLVTDNVLPLPAKCVCCGYSGPDRNYFVFRWQVLMDQRGRKGYVIICTRKNGSGGAGCFDEAAALNPVGFVRREELNEAVTNNYELRAQNDKLELATERFTDRFAGIVSDFLGEIRATPEDIESLADSDLGRANQDESDRVAVSSESDLNGI